MDSNRDISHGFISVRAWSVFQPLWLDFEAEVILEGQISLSAMQLTCLDVYFAHGSARR